MRENRIYFNAGHTSFNITRWKANNSVWYDWVERSCWLMGRSEMSSKTMEWIYVTLKEASTDQNNSHFYMREKNEHGRYMSILSLNKEVRTGPPRLTEANYPYAKAVQDGKWSSKNLREAEVRSKKGIIEVSAKSGKQEDGLLKGCLIGEQVVKKQREWQKRNFNLEWWSPTSGCISNCSFVKETWVRAVGIPLHLWSQKVFHEIGEKRSEIGSTSHDGFTYDIPIWVERKMRVEISPELTRKSVGEEDDLNYSLMWLEWKPRSDSYADDTLIFCGTEKDQLKHLRVILVLFEGILGLRINWRKSSLYPINDVANMEALNIILGGQVGFLPTTYLGMPFGNHSRFGIQ
ncbi:hypothetical protein H5410_030884 [Solanum commersonii]|uniref:DUF4283 domain-containing protein n=1 Tax=Solanum commersonii TaxID=4109 RepID=A0A9J5YGV0_SOLCO|nr:hypothetical protein H5410_030884 [Solanum commersonii]